MLFSFAFFAGVMALLLQPALPAQWVWGGVAVLALGGPAVFVTRLRALGFVLCGASLGWLLAGEHAAKYLDARWPAKLAGERVIAQVIVDSIPAPRDGGWAFEGVVHIERPDGFPRPFRARLVSRDESLRPYAGERWRMLLTLRPPRGRANPGTQDFERQLFREEVHALGSVTTSSLNRVIDAGHAPLTALRERISLRIQDRVVDRDASALISALAVGDTGRVSREQWRVFNATGTTHLVAISGLHVTLFAVVAFAIARWVWRYCWQAVRVQRDVFASVCAFAAAAGYATLAGLSVPTLRTLIMLGVWLLARCVARVTRPFHPLGLALLAVLVIDPFAPLSAGFWLSFVAMAVIIAVCSGRFIPRPMWKEAVVVQVAVTVALVPFTLALFGSVSLIGPAVNALAIPAMSWVLVPTVLLAVVLMPLSTLASDYVLPIAEWLHDLGWPWLAAASEVPWALLHASPAWWWYAFAVVALVMALMPWPLPLRFAVLICTVPLAVSGGSGPKQGAVEITVLDVGEGTSIVARTASHVLVYGTGDSYGTDGRIAEDVVVPFVRGAGLGSIDMLISSGWTAAESTGITAVLAQMPVQETLVDCETVSTAWVWDGVRFELGPNGSHACRIEIATRRARAFIPGRPPSVAVDFEDDSEYRLAVSSRRREPLGSLHFQMDDAAGVSGPSAYRANKRTLWAVSP